jgi:hypothetical protein
LFIVFCISPILSLLLCCIEWLSPD